MSINHSFYRRSVGSVAALISAGSLLLLASASAQARQVWHAVYNGTASGRDLPLASLAGPSGALYVTGQSVTTNHGTGITTLEYDSSGKQLWAHAETLSSLDGYNEPVQFSAIAQNPANGDISVCGMRSNNQFATVATYTSSGKRLAGFEVKLPSGLYGVHLLVYPNGDFSIAGTAAVVFEENEVDYSYWYSSRYTATGKLIWSDFYSGSGDPSPYEQNVVAGAALDSAGDLVVAGTVEQDSGLQQIAVRKYDSAGKAIATGLLNDPSSYGEDAVSMALDKSGDIYVAGNSANTSAGIPEFVLAKFLPDAEVKWRGLYAVVGSNGKNDSVHADALTLDSDGNAIVGGILGAENQYDRLLVKWDSVGHMVWVSKGSEAQNEDYLVSIPNSDAFYAIGDGGGASSGSGSGIVVSLFDSDGKLHADEVYTGLANSGATTASGAAYDTLSGGVYMFDVESLENPAGYSDDDDWVTAKFQFGQ